MQPMPYDRPDYHRSDRERMDRERYERERYMGDRFDRDRAERDRADRDRYIADRGRMSHPEVERDRLYAATSSTIAGRVYAIRATARSR